MVKEESDMTDVISAVGSPDAEPDLPDSAHPAESSAAAAELARLLEYGFPH